METVFRARQVFPASVPVSDFSRARMGGSVLAIKDNTRIQHRIAVTAGVRIVAFQRKNI
jgi:hypothetical protein